MNVSKIYMLIIAAVSCFGLIFVHPEFHRNILAIIPCITAIHNSIVKN